MSDPTAIPRPLPFELLIVSLGEEWGGQLCDLIIADADLRVWDRLFGVIEANYRYTFTLVSNSPDAEKTNQIPRPLPASSASLLASINSKLGPWPSLSFDVAGLLMIVHFMGEEWIELDFPRRDLTPERYNAVATLMQRMGDSTGRDVFMSPEGASEEGVMVYEMAQRRFRPPRHGKGSDGELKRRVFTRLAEALAPLRAETGKKPIAEELLAVALKKVAAISDSFTELMLQDELSPEERRELRHTWSELATLVTPPAGVDYSWSRPARERDLIQRARRLAI